MAAISSCYGFKLKASSHKKKAASLLTEGVVLFNKYERSALLEVITFYDCTNFNRKLGGKTEMETLSTVIK